jgi:DegV family protein with EDD domain
MRIGLVVDSTCELPREYLDAHHVIVQPIKIHMGNATFVDERNATESLRFYREHLGEQGHAAESTPFTVEQIRELFLTKLVVDFDFVFCLCIMSSRSPIYENSVAASREILRYYHPIRKDAGLKGIFQMRVIDSQTLFAGQAIGVLEAVKMIEAGESHTAIYERLGYLAKNTYAYMLPRDLYYLRARAAKKGDKSVSWFRAALGTALDIKPLLQAYRGQTGAVGKARGFEAGSKTLLGYVSDRVRKGLLSPHVNLSYGGELEKLYALPGYDELARTCEQHQVELGATGMSITGMVNVGEGALTVGFAAEPHTPKFQSA